MIVFFLPAGVLVVSYLAICVSAGTAWPWQAVVHESGRLTLAQTVLYYEHAASELPLDLLTGASAAAGLICFRRARPHLAGVEAGRLRGRLRVAGTVLFAGVMLILAGTVLTRGRDELRLHLLQNYTRLGEPAIFGSHWRYLGLGYCGGGSVASGPIVKAGPGRSAGGCFSEKRPARVTTYGEFENRNPDNTQDSARSRSDRCACCYRGGAFCRVRGKREPL